ncbi:hypothetical protein, partial [Streptomyces clavifer]|uniref:hypothetical protein n=1 Tax=Streptomyces clavifer TaxID=68188 RepID=UPI003646A555
MSTDSTPALLKGAAGADAVGADGPAPARRDGRGGPRRPPPRAPAARPGAPVSGSAAATSPPCVRS